MLGEYHRHVALIHIFQDDWKSALPHLEQSLDYRKKAGAIDASLFAALTLGRALEETGNPDGAKPQFEYALRIARSIPSPVGIARAEAALQRVVP